MDQHSERHVGPSVEFLDDITDPPAAPGDHTDRLRWRWLDAIGRPSWLSLALSGVMSVGSVIAIVSVFFTQLTFRPFLFGHAHSTYAIDGLGRFHLVGRGSPNFALDGDGPMLGVVTIVAAVVLLLAAAVALLPKRGVAAVSAGVACLSAGGLAAALACEAIVATGYPKYAWAAGFWLLVVGASLAALGALVNAVIAQHQSITGFSASALRLGVSSSDDPAG